MATLNDGLGFEELVLVSGVGLTTQNPFFTGSVTTGDRFLGPTIVASTALSGLVLQTGVVSGTNLRFNAAFVNGSIVLPLVSGAGINTGVLSGTNLRFNNSIANGSAQAASWIFPYADAQGTVINNLNAEAIISGGMWVVGSAASGTTPTIVLKPAATNELGPLGICLANVASGTAARLLVQGFYQGLVAEATLSAGMQFAAGAGGALNAAKVAASGNVESNARGTVLMGAGSEGTILAYLW